MGEIGGGASGLITRMTKMLETKDILFVGVGNSAICWYRIALPAMYLGCDWAGLDHNLRFVTGIVNKNTEQPILDQYKIVVWQQPRTREHLQAIRRLRSLGVIVVAEVDDYLHGVRNMKDHDFSGHKRQAGATNKKGFRQNKAPERINSFSKKSLASFDSCLRECDAMIASTEWLANKYRAMFPTLRESTHVCLNGLDLGRYDKGRPNMSGVTLGWAGATGHQYAFDRISPVIEGIMNDYDNVNFVSIGQSFAEKWPQFGNRILSLPFTSLENYPNGMTMFDIALAPARESDWYRAKSALRAYEAAALGVPIVASSIVYSELPHGVVGYIADTPEEWDARLRELIEDEAKRTEMGLNARKWAWDELDMAVRCTQWDKALYDIYANHNEEDNSERKSDHAASV